MAFYFNQKVVAGRKSLSYGSVKRELLQVHKLNLLERLLICSTGLKKETPTLAPVLLRYIYFCLLLLVHI